MRICGKYLGDNDGTCPQLTCIRGPGHPGPCDNTFADHQVWGVSAVGAETGVEAPVPVSFVYDRRNTAEIVRAVAKSQMPGFRLAIVSSDEVGSEASWGPIHYGSEDGEKRCLSHAEAMDLFRRLGW